MKAEETQKHKALECLRKDNSVDHVTTIKLW